MALTLIQHPGCVRRHLLKDLHNTGVSAKPLFSVQKPQHLFSIIYNIKSINACFIAINKSDMHVMPWTAILDSCCSSFECYLLITVNLLNRLKNSNRCGEYLISFHIENSTESASTRIGYSLMSYFKRRARR